MPTSSAATALRRPGKPGARLSLDEAPSARRDQALLLKGYDSPKTSSAAIAKAQSPRDTPACPPELALSPARAAAIT